MNTDAYSRLAEENSLGRLIDVKRIKRGNDIDRIVTSDGSFFCKTYTKSWYGRPEENSYPVSHEATPFSPPSGLATGSFNGLHTKSKFLAFIKPVSIRASMELPARTG
jgi:hypothetical protein